MTNIFHEFPLSLYIHIPWCIRKCPYCDFNSHKSPDTLPEMEYVRALLEDLDQDLEKIAQRPLHSIFLGGGTPSLFSAKAYDTLFSGIRSRLDCKDSVEITLEANPGTVEQQRFKDYRALGINRLSLGIQSFNAQHLKSLGRIHDSQQALDAVEAARLAGFDNINLDLMHGLPGQTVAEGLEDLRTALSFHPEHLSWYQLTLEPNTQFYKTQPVLPGEDDCWELEQQGLKLLADAGLQRYEISAFARVGLASQHNMNYWTFGDYLGIGAGAHGKISEENTVWRTRKHKQPKDYLDPGKPYRVEWKAVETQDLTFEFMLNLTRLQQAIPLTWFEERTGLAPDHFLKILHQAEQKGLVVIADGQWQVTPRGRQFTNDLQAMFL